MTKKERKNFMKIFKKVMAMGLATMAVMSAFGAVASAKSPIYDENGVLQGYEYYESDFDMEKLKAAAEDAEGVNHNTRVSGIRPSYGDAFNLSYTNSHEIFNLRNTSAGKTSYSNAYRPSTDGFFVAFVDDSDCGNFTTELYSLTTSNASSGRLETWVPSNNVIGRSYLRSSYPAAAYYFKLSINSGVSNAYADMFVTGDQDVWESVLR